MADPQTLYDYYDKQGKTLPSDYKERFSLPGFSDAAKKAGYTPETYASLGSNNAQANSAIFRNLMGGTTTAESVTTTPSSRPTPTVNQQAASGQMSPTQPTVASPTVTGPVVPTTSPTYQAPVLTPKKTAAEYRKTAYEDVLPMYQGAIDTARDYYAKKVEETLGQEEKNLGSIKAMNAAFGLMGSPEGATSTARETRRTDQTLQGIRNQEAMEIANIMNNVESNAIRMAELQASLDEADVQEAAKLKEKSVQDAEKAIETFAKSPTFDFEKFKTTPQYKSLAEQLGRGTDYVDAIYAGSVPVADVLQKWTSGTKVYQLVQTPGGSPKVMSYDVGQEVPPEWKTQIDSKGNFIAYDPNDPTKIIVKQIGSSSTGTGIVQIPGGTIAATHNNPLNVKYGTSTKPYVDNGAATIGQSALDGGNFLKFNTPEEGLAAAQALLMSSVYNTLSVDQAMKKWSNSGYGGEIAPDLQNKKVGELTPQEQDRLVQAMAKRESGSTIQPNLGGKGNELLSVSEAKELGVPYGTTRGQAAGITPGKTAEQTEAFEGTIMAQPAYSKLGDADKKMAKSTDDLLREIKTYRDYLDKYVDDSGALLTGADSAVIEGMLNSIIFLAAQAEGTGALQEADRKVIEKIFPNPSSVSGGINALMKGGKQGQLDKIDTQLTKYAGRLSGFGLKPTVVQMNSTKERATKAGYDYEKMRETYTDEQIDEALNQAYASENN